MKKLIFIILFLILICTIYIFKFDLKYIKEYTPGKSNIKGNVDIKYFNDISNDFEIGANIYGYAVFKKPNKAYDTLIKLYSEGINIIKQEYNLDDISKNNYKNYSVYGWQITTGSIEQQEQARFVSQFFDIYENSYVR